MKTLLVGVLATAGLTLGLAAQTGQTPRPVPSRPAGGADVPPSTAASAADTQTAVVKQYCTGCHSDRGKAGGLSLAQFDAAKAVDNAAVAEKMIRKLRL